MHNFSPTSTNFPYTGRKSLKRRNIFLLSKMKNFGVFNSNFVVIKNKQNLVYMFKESFKI